MARKKGRSTSKASASCRRGKSRARRSSSATRCLDHRRRRPQPSTRYLGDAQRSLFPRLVFGTLHDVGIGHRLVQTRTRLAGTVWEDLNDSIFLSAFWQRATRLTRSDLAVSRRRCGELSRGGQSGQRRRQWNHEHGRRHAVDLGGKLGGKHGQQRVGWLNVGSQWAWLELGCERRWIELEQHRRRAGQWGERRRQRQ